MTKLRFSLCIMLSAFIIFGTVLTASGQTVKFAGTILKWISGQPQLNYDRNEALIREAAAGGAKIVCITECALDGYSVRDTQPFGTTFTEAQYRSFAERVPGGIFLQQFQALADELDIYLAAGMTELEGTGIDEHTHNTVVFIDPNGILLGKYQKWYLYPGEASINTSGNAWPVFATPYGRIGFMICADRQKKETMDELKKGNPTMVICPSGGMWSPKNNDVYVIARSTEGNVYIPFVHPILFLVTSPDGEVLDRRTYGNQMDDTPPDYPWGGVVMYYDIPITSINPTKLLASASPAVLEPGGGGTSTITVQVCDNDNNLVSISSAVITFSLSGSGSLQTPLTRTASGGIATITYTAGTQTETVIITATSPGLTSVSVDVDLIMNTAPGASTNLLSNGQADPAVVDLKPTFSWAFNDDNAGSGDVQSACRVLVADSLTALNADNGNLWDSNKVVTANNSLTYGGTALQEGTVCYWKVMTWDDFDAQSVYSQPAQFTTYIVSASGYQDPNVPANTIDSQ